jgi:ketosteroid isomerase-like protein
MRTSVAVTGLVVFVASAFAVASRSSRGAGGEKQRVLAAEDAYAAAEVKRDEQALRRLIDDQFGFNSANAVESGKEELIRSVLGMNMTGQTISERSVKMEGDVAVIFGTTELRFEDPGVPPRSSRLRYTSVYIKRNNEWRMLALQMQPRSTP